eukprot:4207195-Prymnesium_polylepis.1
MSPLTTSLHPCSTSKSSQHSEVFAVPRSYPRPSQAMQGVSLNSPTPWHMSQRRRRCWTV